MKSADYIARFLKEHGIRDCCGYQGTMIAHFVDAVSREPGLRCHFCGSEQGAAFAAVGEAKTTGETAFAFATGGPGAANLISGIADAWFDSAPVVFLTGQLNTYEVMPVPGLRQSGFQEMDTVSIVRPIVKYARRVTDAADLRYVLEAAFYYASEGRKGPVLIDLPMDVQREEIDPKTLRGFVPPRGENGSGSFVRPVDAVRREKSSIPPVSPEHAAKTILQSLSRSEKPLLALGNGIATCDDPAVRRIIEKLNVPVVTSIFGRSILPSGHPLNFGHIGSAYGFRSANLIINRKCDLIVALGIRLCPRQTGMHPEQFAGGAKLLRIDIDPAELSRKIHQDEVAMLADSGEVLRHLIRLLESREEEEPLEFPESLHHRTGSRAKWLTSCRRIQRKTEAFDDSLPERAPNDLIREISRHTGFARVISVDVGQHQMWCAASWQIREGQRMIFSGGHGAMGFALPAAVGAHYASGSPVVCVSGDGAFQMNIQELELIRREQLPVTCFVLNNRSLGLIRQQQDALFQSRYAGSAPAGGYTAPSFAKIAAAYGIRSFLIKDKEELAPLLRNLDPGVPNLIEVLMPETSCACPKARFGAPMHDQEPRMPEELMESLLEEDGSA